jgi:acyl-CoA dehydrogenase
VALDFTLPPELRDLLDRVRAYVEEEALPAEAEIAGATDLLPSWHVVERLRDRARERGLYTPHLPEAWGGLGIGPLGMALISQECGVSGLASLGLNAMAPDEGNMHTLLIAGTGEQQEAYLRPLAEGRIRSCFAMTEPDVASSDPTNLETTAVRDGRLGAERPQVVHHRRRRSGVRDRRRQDRQRRERRPPQLLARDRPHRHAGRIVRHPEWMGSHSPGGHPEIELADVRVPAGNLLGGEGEGFAIAQKRLAGGRLAHAMRWIGAAQRALDLSSARLLTRKAFGKELARHQGLQLMLADSAMDLYASRLMVLHTAWKLEHGLPHRQEVAMTKTFVSEAFGRIADRAVQMHGAAGIAMDLPIARIFQDARAARIYDGASEVHRMVVARHMLKLAMQGESVRAACGEL